MKNDNGFIDHLKSILEEVTEINKISEQSDVPKEELKAANIIVENLCIPKVNEIKILNNIKESFNKSRLGCLVVPTSWLFAIKKQEFRDYIISNFHCKGVVTLKANVFKETFISTALVLIDFKQGDTWFTTATNINQLDILLKNINNHNRKIYYTGLVDSKNLMPEHYNGEKEEIKKTLDKYKTKKLEEIADIFIGKDIVKKELSNNEGVQYLRAKNITTFGIESSDAFVNEKFIRKYAKYLLQSGDILLTRCFGQLKYVQVKDSDLPAIASGGLIVIRSADIPEDYLYSYLTSKTGEAIFKKQLSLIKKGYTIEFISISELKKLKIPIFDEKTMIEISEIDNMNHNKACELTEKIGKHISEREIENIVINQLNEAGWIENDLEHDSRKCRITIRNHIWCPDIVLLNKENIIAIVEIKVFINKINEKWIKHIQEVINDKIVPILILTNGMFYDVYVTDTNQHRRFYSAPSKNDICQLLEIGGVYNE